MGDLWLYGGEQFSLLEYEEWQEKSAEELDVPEGAVALTAGCGDGANVLFVGTPDELQALLMRGLALVAGARARQQTKVPVTIEQKEDGDAAAEEG